MQETLGIYVEPVQLQVVCYRLWQGLDTEKMQIDEQEIAHVGDVNQSLSDYYAERVAVAADSTGVLERSIRDWFEHKLITEQGIRSQVLMGQQQSEELDNRAIFKLVDAHLVRADKRRGITWFELAHDRLIRPVRTNNETWFQANLSLLQRQAALWHKENRPEHLLLREQALQQAEQWAATHAGELTAVDKDFLEASQMVRQREQEARERQEQAIKLKVQARLANILRALLAVALVAAVAAIFFAFTAFNARDQATTASNQNATLAALNATNANYAQEQSTLAVGNAATADANAGTAQAASTVASAERATADAARLRRMASTGGCEQRATAEYNADVAETNAKEVENRPT
jgi:hypothetical protein